MIGHNAFGLKSLTFELLATTLIGIALLGSAAAEDRPAGIPDAAAGSPLSGLKDEPGDFRTLLPLLLTSPDRKQLAADLESAIRQGNLQAAEGNLNTAIEVGTLAIVLIDHLRDPKLLTALQALGIRGEARPAAAPGACAAPPMPSQANLADMQQAIEQERSLSSTVSQTLAELMQEHNTLAARLETQTESHAAKEAEIQHALQQEQERKEAAQRDLTKLQEENRALKVAWEQDKASTPPNARELEALLRQEREQRDTTARQLAGAQKELRDLQSSKTEASASALARIAELEKSLSQAQTRSDFLTQELTDTADELRKLQEPQQPSPTPVVFRLAATGAEPPLAPAQPDAPAPEAKAPQIALPAPAVNNARPAAPEATAALPLKEPAVVVVASLPEGIQPLPLPSTIVERPKAEPPAVAEPKPDERLTNRAEELLRKGDVSGARLLLEHALASGNARAAFLLAETFDPNVLTKLGVLGIRGDAAKAREFYAQARALGFAQAGERMEALK